MDPVEFGYPAKSPPSSDYKSSLRPPNRYGDWELNTVFSSVYSQVLQTLLDFRPRAEKSSTPLSVRLFTHTSEIWKQGTVWNVKR